MRALPLSLILISSVTAACGSLPTTQRAAVRVPDAALAAKVAHRVLVKLKPGRSSALARLGFASSQGIAKLGWQVVDVPGGAREAAAALRRDPDVLAAEPDQQLHVFETPTFNDPDLPNRVKTHACIRMEQAWAITTGKPNVVVAILDTGVDAGHPDLVHALVPGYDTVNDDATPEDDHSHGTSCAGIVAAEGNNGIGTVGMAPGCRVMPVKVLNKRGVGPLEWAAKGIVWAADHGASIVSMSFGEDERSQVLQDAVDYARAKNVLCIASMGNDGEEVKHWPAACDDVLAVGATYDDDRPALFTTEGAWVAIAAPGTRVHTTSPTYPLVDPMFGKRDLDYTWFSGTSASSPVVAAVAALVRSQFPGIGEAELRARLRKTSDDVGAPGWDKQSGDGRVNAWRALTGS